MQWIGTSSLFLADVKHRTEELIACSCRGIFSYFSKHDDVSALKPLTLNPLFNLVGTGKKNEINTEGCSLALGITSSFDWVVHICFCMSSVPILRIVLLDGPITPTIINPTVRAALKSQCKEAGHKMPSLLL